MLHVLGNPGDKAEHLLPVLLLFVATSACALEHNALIYVLFLVLAMMIAYKLCVVCIPIANGSSENGSESRNGSLGMYGYVYIHELVD